MDINQSALPQYKSGKPGIALSRSEANQKAEAARYRDTRTTSANADGPRPEWKEGQIVKGEIVDRRFDEVTIRLEPGKQVITAKITGDIPLSIGQSAQFQVTDNAAGQLTLKYLPADTNTSSDLTILKALIASNFPATDRNKAIVEELLNHRMSIDKQTLQTLVKQSHISPEASPRTLVLMLKNNIPMTASNVRQYEQYQSGNNQMLDDIHTISDNLVNMLKESGNTITGKTIEFNQSLINILANPSDTDQITYSAQSSINHILGKEELAHLSTVLEQKLSENGSITENLRTELTRQLSDGSMTLSDAAKLIARLYPQYANITEQVTMPSTPDSLDPVMNTLLKTFQQLSSDTTELATMLNPVERKELLDMLHLPADSGQLKNNIIDGNVSTEELFRYINKNITNPDSPLDTSLIKELISSPLYRKLMEEGLRQKWTITPEKLTDKESVKKLYNDLQEDMDKLSNLLKVGNETSERLQTQDSVNHLQENLKFMKDLNEVFTYLPLPVQLKDQDVHSDLYIFTKKDALKNRKENLSVLLHLDMANLGPLNINIQMDHNQINAVFYLENKDAGNLISNNISSLEEALKKNGYHLYASVENTYEKPDFTKDFIEENSLDSNIKRFTFDIRT